MRYIDYGPGFGMMGAGLGLGFGVGTLILIAWTLYWKGKALWRAARLGHLEWFIALLIINTAGLLEIAYLYYFTKSEKAEMEVVSDKEKKD
ncbi:MAG TPA: DUF5652 family protein [Candidatus Paceibacterota bacterium]|nr:DUF5652 family protein [Candidatus Paceibacterota bacterium]